jgi:hypothetical protein
VDVYPGRHKPVHLDIRNETMSDTPWTESITTTAEFEAALETLIAAAHANDIDVRGSYVCDDDGHSRTEMEVLIHELE